MTVIPPLSVPIINPEQFSEATPSAYLTVSEFLHAPTAVDTSELVDGGTAQDQLVELANIISRVSAWMDVYTMGIGGTLAASANTKGAWIKPRRGWVSFVLDYKPVLEVTAVGIGINPGAVVTIDANTAAMSSLSGKVLTFPALAYQPSTTLSTSQIFPRRPDGRIWAQVTYINGYPHTTLAASASQGATSISVGSTLGCQAGTQLTIYDNAITERITVTAVTSPTALATTALAYGHTVPAAPDGLTVSALPHDIKEAAILLTCALIKEKGEGGIVLDSFDTEPSKVRSGSAAGGLGVSDMEIAAELLNDYRISTRGTT